MQSEPAADYKVHQISKLPGLIHPHNIQTQTYFIIAVVWSWGKRKKPTKLHAYLKWKKASPNKTKWGKTHALDKNIFLPAVTALQFILDSEFSTDGKIISILQGTHIMYPNY